MNTDRSRAQQAFGFSQKDVANNLLLTLSGSGQISPTFWLNPETGVQYPIARADASSTACRRSRPAGNPSR